MPFLGERIGESPAFRFGGFESDSEPIVLEEVVSLRHILSYLRSPEIGIDLFLALYLIYRGFCKRKIPSDPVVGDEHPFFDTSDPLSESDREDSLYERLRSIVFLDGEDIFLEGKEMVS